MAHRLRPDERDSEPNSSPISSAPVSPHHNEDSDTIQVATRPASTIPDAQRGGVASSKFSATTAQPPTAATAQTTTLTTTQAAQPEKPKRVRKKKELGPDGKPLEDDKPKTTNPRKQKEKPVTNGTSTTTTTAARKKIKVEPKPDEALTRQPTITEMISSYGTAQRNSPSMVPLPPPLSSTTSIPRPSTSGQKYDPVRGMTMEYVRPPPPTPALRAPSPAQINRASASPSIASLIDPPVITNTVQATSHSPRGMVSQLFVDSSPQATKNATPSPSPTFSRTLPTTEIDGAMDIDKSPSSKTTKPTAKPPVRSSPPAPRGTGSGLLSNSDLIGGPSSSEGVERKGVDIDIQIKLDPKGGNHINVAQEIIKKYGRDALNPRAAAHRERLLEVMAAANKVEGMSTDDMSIDLMSDLGDDSNIEMGGMEDDPSAADGDKPRKRRKKTEEYDIDDEFIDDTELAWQQQAAVAKDGFFVYSGPLIPAGENARVEAANASTRGRAGRGRGGRKAAGTATHASLAEKKESAPGSASPAAAKPRGRARAPAAPRKPRPTKAERDKLDAEKAARIAAAASPSSAPVPPPLSAPAAQLALVQKTINVST